MPGIFPLRYQADITDGELSFGAVTGSVERSVYSAHPGLDAIAMKIERQERGHATARVVVPTADLAYPETLSKLFWEWFRANSGDIICRLVVDVDSDDLRDDKRLARRRAAAAL